MAVAGCVYGHEGRPRDNTPLALGNPSAALPDVQNDCNYLMEKATYALSYNNSTHTANWVAWHLDADDLGTSGRSNYFYADTMLPRAWYALRSNDFQYALYGFERGHLCPSGDRTHSREMNRETFLMTNMIPQAPDNNGGVWKALEEYARSLARAGSELYMYAGPAGRGGTSARGTYSGIPIPDRSAVKQSGASDNGSPVYSDNVIAVPAYMWKILLVLPVGDDDVARITADTTVIAVLIPNANGCSTGRSWQFYCVSVDDIEALTGYDFFTELDGETEAAVERAVYAP